MGCNEIKKEQTESEKYYIKTEESEDDIVQLTRENVALIEAMIRNDSSYIKSSDENAEPVTNNKDEFIYGGSTAYWAKELKKLLKNKSSKQQDEDKYKFETIIKNIVASIDRENSTHLNADGVGRDEISKRIIDEKDRLIDLLKNENKNYEIIELISKKTNPNNGKKGRENISFASKFAHYLAFYLFEEDDDNKDNFSIYDGVLTNALPKYAKFYNIKMNLNKKTKKDIYIEYQKVIDEIIKKANEEHGEEISRNGFDHLLWYYHKGRS